MNNIIDSMRICMHTANCSIIAETECPYLVEGSDESTEKNV